MVACTSRKRTRGGRERMKKIIYRDKATGKISHDVNYDEYLRYFGEEQIAAKINEYNSERRFLQAEIVELDDVAEFYAKRAEQHLNLSDEIAERLREIASKITDIADEIDELRRR